MESHNNIEFYLLSLDKFITTRLDKQKMRVFISHKSKLILEKNQFNMQEQYYATKYLIPLNLLLLLLSKKNIKNNKYQNTNRVLKCYFLYVG